MNRTMLAAVPFLAAALLVAGPVSATTAKKVSCQQIRTELQAGKTPAEVEKDLKVSKKDVDHCSAKVASNKKHTTTHGMSGGSQPAPAPQ
jgi:hypothetical protein